MIRAGALSSTAILIGLLALPAHAQVAQADLRGTVADESGGALPGVTVTATHVDTGASRTTTSTATGVFIMRALPVGRYRLQLELAGFNTIVQQDLPLEVGQSVAVTFTMKIATVAETVKDFEASAWFGMGAPKGTPPEIIAALNKAANEVLAEPLIKQRLSDLGGVAMAGTPEDFGKVIQSETEKWEKVVRFAGAKVE